MPAWCPDCQRERTVDAGHTTEDSFPAGQRVADSEDLEDKILAQLEQEIPAGWDWYRPI